MKTCYSIKPVCLFCTLTVSVISSGATSAGEIDIEQGGQRGSVLLQVSPQTPRYDVELRQSGIENKLDVGVSNAVDALIHQHGSFGLIDLELNGRNDVVIIDQAGSSNTLVGSMSGQSNNTRVDQNGRDNNIDFGIGGRSNNLDMHQGGSNNTLSLDHSTNNSQLTLRQSGHSNHMRIDHSSSNIGLNISQDGSSGSVVVTD